MNSLTRSCIHLLLAAGVTVGPAAHALDAPEPDHPGQPGHFGHPGRGFGGLGAPDLSDAQQDKLFAIDHAIAPQLREHERAARRAHEALRALADAAPFDEGRASALAQAEGKAVAALALIRARADAQRQAVLTPEQRSRAKDQRGAWSPRP